jgi:hypothetical protein
MDFACITGVQEMLVAVDLEVKVQQLDLLRQQLQPTQHPQAGRISQQVVAQKRDRLEKAILYLACQPLWGTGYLLEAVVAHTVLPMVTRVVSIVQELILIPEVMTMAVGEIGILLALGLCLTASGESKILLRLSLMRKH